MVSLVILYVCTCVTVLLTFHYLLKLWLQKIFVQFYPWQCYVIATRVISAILATSISLVALRTLYITEDIMYQRDPMLENLCLMLSGYFAYDIIVMYKGYTLKLCHTKSKQYPSKVILLKFLKQELFMVIHHLLLQIAGLPLIVYVIYYRDGFAMFFVAGIFIAEASTPFYSVRGILKDIGHASGRLYEINGLLFLMSFFVCRICAIPYLYYRYAVYKNISFASVPLNIPIHCNISCLAFFSLQLYWFVLIIKVIMRYSPNKQTENVRNLSHEVNHSANNGVLNGHDLNGVPNGHGLNTAKAD